MAVRMMLNPLELSSPVIRVIVPPIVSATQFFLLRWRTARAGASAQRHHSPTVFRSPQQATC